MEETKMNKLKIFTALSKAFAYITWATSNVVHIVGKVGRQTIDRFSVSGRYDVEIYHGNEQVDKKENINHSELLRMINSIEAFPHISLIVTRRTKDQKDAPSFEDTFGKDGSLNSTEERINV